jgi:hypothetical protein
MSSLNKVLLKILVGKSDNNIHFDEVCNLLLSMGFELRIKGSHHIFRKEGINTKINLQRDGNMAKNYQIKQVRNMILENNLGDL